MIKSCVQTLRQLDIRRILMKGSSMIRVAFIGAGYMASEHLRAFSDCPDVKLVGIHSRNPKKSQKLAEIYPTLRVTHSIDELYENTRPDLVVIAVPILSCLSVCEHAFNHGWTLLIEKPVGHTLAEAHKIKKLSDDYKARAYVALNRRFFSSTLQMKQELKSNAGQRVVTILDQEDAESALAAGQPPKVVHNWMYANSIHLIDYFSQLCRGEHIRTEILTQWNPEDPGPVVAQLQFSSGDIGLYQAVWNAPGPWSVAVSTAHLRAELRPIECLSLQKAGSRQAELQAADPLDQQFKPGLLRQAQAAIQAAKGQATTLPSLKEANRSMALVASIYGTQ